MKKLYKRAKEAIASKVISAKIVLSNQSSEGFVDTAIFFNHRNTI